MNVLVIVLLAGILALLLVQFQRRYEQQSANDALRSVEALQERVDALTRRVEHLEAIATADEELLALDEPGSDEEIAPESDSSVSLHRSRNKE